MMEFVNGFRMTSHIIMKWKIKVMFETTNQLVPYSNFHGSRYPLVNKQFAIENGPVEIVDFPINSMVDLSIVMKQFTRGYTQIL